MASERDPEGNELFHLVNAQPIIGKQVVEIGCGDGKLTSQYAQQARCVFGIDPDMNDLHAARNKVLSGEVFYIQARGEALPFKAGLFDLVIFASSL